MLKVPDCTQQIGHPECESFGFLRTPSLVVLESHTSPETEYSWVLLSSGVSAIPVTWLVCIAIYSGLWFIRRHLFPINVSDKPGAR